MVGQGSLGFLSDPFGDVILGVVGLDYGANNVKSSWLNQDGIIPGTESRRRGKSATLGGLPAPLSLSNLSRWSSEHKDRHFVVLSRHLKGMPTQQNTRDGMESLDGYPITGRHCGAVSPFLFPGRYLVERCGKSDPSICIRGSRAESAQSQSRNTFSHVVYKCQ